MWFHRSKHSQVGNPASASGVAIAKIGSVLPRAQKKSDGAKSRQKALPDKTDLLAWLRAGKHHGCCHSSAVD